MWRLVLLFLGALIIPSLSEVHVIGHYPEYLDMAETYHLDCYNISDAEWLELTQQDRWIRNYKWLEEGMAAEDLYLLATHPLRVRKDSTLEREIHVLMDNGYQVYFIKPPSSCNGGECVLTDEK